MPWPAPSLANKARLFTQRVDTHLLNLVLILFPIKNVRRRTGKRARFPDTSYAKVFRDWFRYGKLAKTRQEFMDGQE